MQNRVLFVDDDAQILAAFRRQLRRKVEIETVSSADAGLEAIRTRGPFSVVVTDYCMPEMNGIEFLARVRAAAPESVRMLLTGSADLKTAIQAVNQGYIFRFLTKPCGSEDLMEALLSGIKEYRRAHKERKFNKRTRRSLAQAMDVQQGLMPSSRPDLDGMDIAGRSVFCDQTGGDYYDYFEKGPAENRRISIVVGDVSDHGLPSALLMTTARAALRQSAFSPGSISSIVERVNRQLTRDIQTSGRFVTLFYAEINATATGLRWVRAGHEPALLFDQDTGIFEELNGQGGLPLGVIEDAVYKEDHRLLRPGQLIAIGTDGIWEARNRDGCMFGKPRLQQVIREKADQPASEIVQGVLESLKQFLSPLAIQDDATLVVVKVKG